MPRKQHIPEWHHIPVVFTDWDCSYHFGLKSGKCDTGCIGQYSELPVVTLIGTVFGVQKDAKLAENQAVNLHLYFKDDTQLALDESNAAEGAYIQNGILSVVLNIPKSSSAYFRRFLGHNAAYRCLPNVVLCARPNPVKLLSDFQIVACGFQFTCFH